MKKIIIIFMAVLLAAGSSGCIYVKINDQEKEIKEDEKKPENNEVKYELNEEGIIKTEYAKEIIEETAAELINAISDKDFEKVSEYVHPEKGVRFTPYTNVSVDNDVVLSQEEVKNFFNDKTTYIWGHYDGRGDDISLTPGEYYDEFIYSEDFINAEAIGYNEVLSSGNMAENQFEVYQNAIIVEYYFPGFNPDFGGADWKSLRLVFEEYEGTWRLTGIIHNQWTI
ncbi:MAG: hypothetical protein AAGU39_11040 [Sedimentibacter saalensis]|jgi:hypothetical protein|uniref:hypothetical protein n=1 Tax=Sedimentibacter saalensis TaxID=130788 RepID=UPI0031591B91